MAGSAAAMEHEFNGLLRIKGDATNFDQAGGNDTMKASTRKPENMLSQGTTGKSFFFTEQRARLRYTGVLSDDVKIVTQARAGSLVKRAGTNPQAKTKRCSPEESPMYS